MRVVRFLLLTAALALMALSAGVATGSPESHALLQELVRAHRDAPLIHTAMLWRVSREGMADQVIMTEAYRDGARAGLRTWHAQSGREISLALTNGALCWIVQRDERAACSEGAAAINQHMVPYLRACEYLAEQWGCARPSESPVAPTFALMPTDEADGFTFDLLLAARGTPSWLNCVPAQGVGEPVLARPGRVNIDLHGASLTINARNGMPEAFVARTGTKTIEAKKAAVAWTVAQWESAVATGLKLKTEDFDWTTSCGFASRGMLRMLTWYWEEAEMSPTRQDRMWELSALCSSVDVAVHAEQGAGARGSGRDDVLVPQSATAGDESDAGVERVLDTVKASLAAHRHGLVESAEAANWTEGDVAGMCNGLIYAYRVALYMRSRTR